MIFKWSNHKGPSNPLFFVHFSLDEKKFFLGSRGLTLTPPPLSGSTTKKTYFVCVFNYRNLFSTPFTALPEETTVVRIRIHVEPSARTVLASTARISMHYQQTVFFFYFVSKKMNELDYRQKKKLWHTY